MYKFLDKYIKKLSNNIFVATAIRTAYELNNAKSIPDKNKFYFIQDFEAWQEFTPEDVYKSYVFPMKKIAIAPWLVERVRSASSDAVLIPNGFDFDYFRMMNPIERRSAYEICMLYHDDDRKRCADSIAALKIVKEKIPELHVNIFGTPKRPDDLPDWFSYFQLPDKDTHNRIYNDSAIFVAASKAEGMALPPAEAMICGAALCCTDIDGFALYAIDGETALTSAVYDVAALAKNIEKLICDNDLRIKIAKQGNEFIKQFTWEKAVEKFEAVLKSNFSD